MADPKLNHHILIRYKPQTKQSHIDEFCRKMLALPQQIPAICDLQIGQDILHDERSWDLLLSMRFNSLEALRSYQQHEAHREVMVFNQPHVRDVASIDYNSVLSSD